MIEPALQTLSQAMLYPYDESLEFEDWEKTWRQWTWCDALFMSPPALAMAARATGDGHHIAAQPLPVGVALTGRLLRRRDDPLDVA